MILLVDINKQKERLENGSLLSYLKQGLNQATRMFAPTKGVF
jgi:hypothetical protein